MDLRERLCAYEVTSLPRRRRPALRLVWSVAGDPERTDDRQAGVPPLAMLADYRITRVPGRAAS